MFRSLGTKTPPLFSLTVFSSAFLLFQIQPMIARYLLPFFGGSVSVWAASLVFFTTALFFGYLYVFFITKFSIKVQLSIHGLFLMVATLMAFVGLTQVSGDTPTLGGALESSVIPAFKVIIALISTVGIPYLLLASTGPLLQYWYTQKMHAEPYHLYSLSNLGSFIALGTYPFVSNHCSL
ncbi:MAG: hypothetical protein AAB421_00720 [Patescibacteria group bacterium]